MNARAFVQALNAGAHEKPTGNIERVHQQVQGFSAPCLMKVLSLAVNNLCPGEYYLEIGSFKGRSLIGAMIDNPLAHAISVDNFSEFQGNVGAGETSLKANLEMFGLKDRVTCYSMDCQDFLQEHTEYHGKVGAYFYDGNHDTEQGLGGLIAAIPFLAETAIILMDDISGHGIWRSLARFMAAHAANVGLVFAMATTKFPFGDERWHNGIVALQWNRMKNVVTLVG